VTSAVVGGREPRLGSVGVQHAELKQQTATETAQFGDDARRRDEDDDEEEEEGQ
jgi:hypothetical protein